MTNHPHGMVKEFFKKRGIVPVAVHRDDVRSCWMFYGAAGPGTLFDNPAATLVVRITDRMLRLDRRKVKKLLPDVTDYRLMVD